MPLTWTSDWITQKPKSTGSSLDEFISELEKKLNETAGNEEAAKP